MSYGITVATKICDKSTGFCGKAGIALLKQGGKQLANRVCNGVLLLLKCRRHY